MLYLQIDFGFSLFTSMLSGIVNSILAVLRSIFTFLYALLVAVYNFLAGVIVAVINFAVRVFGRVGAFFRNLWDKWIKRGILKLVDWYSRLRGWLQRVLGPVIRIIRKIRDWLDRVYFPRLMKIINMIQRVRQILQIFRLFNIQWAKRLDARLLQIEQKIAEPYLRLRALLNDVATILNLVLDPSLIMRRNVLLASILRHIGVLRRALGLGNARPLTTAEQIRQERERTRYTAENVRAHVATLASSGLTQEDKDRMADFRDALARVVEA